MQRKEFLDKLSGGLAFTCVSCMMAACSKDSNTSGDNSNNPGDTILLNIDLSAQLLAVKDFISSKGIIVVRIADGNLAGSFVAFFNACTHEGAAVEYDDNTNGFICPRHGATYSISGAVTGAPAPAPLTARTVAVSGSTLTVK
jgi:Rieske Fe-S protein